VNTGRVLRRPLAAIVVVLALAPAAAARPLAGSPLTATLTEALQLPVLSSTRTSALVVDLESGQIVFAQNERLALAPASNEKLAVTYAALAALGPAYRFRTQVLGEGELDDDVWTGDLVLRGFGDPTLSSLGLTRLATQLRLLGIRSVTGAVVADETFFDAARTAPGWKASFAMNESAPLSALSVDRGRYRRVLTSTPAHAAAVRFHELLLKQGIAVAGEPRVGTAGADAFPLAELLSDPLDEILRFMDRESDNFTAELVLKQLGAIVRGAGTTVAGADVVAEELREAGVSVLGARFADGSGLSQLDRLSATTLVQLLRAAWDDRELRAPMWGALAVAGVNGTLEDRLDSLPARGHVRAKTGTTNLASALSGYVDDRYVFSIVQNGRPVPYWWARRAQDRFVQALAAQAA
jgi:D-alanyl-D-alanine carboxypeptidase/D-alanyl-D-alanine-endopeptidase (penicillin-binding protein 4)